MSFDVLLQRFVAGESPSSDPVPILQVLNQYQHSLLDEDGHYQVEFADGTHVEFNALGLPKADPIKYCSFWIRRMGKFLPVFIYQIAQAGDMVILYAGEIGPILLSPDQIADLPDWITEQVPNPIVCHSADELAMLLTKGFDVWRGYRDQIVGR